MTGEPIGNFSPEFIDKIRSKVPDDKWNTLHICPSGLAVTIDKEKNVYYPIGCPLCLLGDKGQDVFGYPTIGGKKLIKMEEYLQKANYHRDISPEISANMWHCPDCGLLAFDLLPKFIRLA